MGIVVYDSMNVALAMSTWNDIAVTYWHQVYHYSDEESYQDSLTERFAYAKRYLYGRKAPVPATLDSVEALLRHELLAHLPEWLSRKAGVLGCTSSRPFSSCVGRRSFRTKMQPDLTWWVRALRPSSEDAHQHVPVCIMARGLDD